MTRPGRCRPLRFAVSAALTAALTATVALPLLAAAPMPALASTPAQYLPRPSITFTAYASQLDRALALVRDSEGKVATERDAGRLADSVTLLLDVGGGVEDGTRTVDFQDGQLTAQLVDLRSAGSAPEREAARADVEAHLVSLRSAVGDPAPAAPRDSAALADLLSKQRVAGGTDAASKLSEWFDRILARLLRWFQDASSTPTGSTGLRTLGIAILLVLAAVLAWVVVVTVRSWRRSVSRREAAAPPRAQAPVVEAAQGLPPDALAFAEDLARQGRFRDAVRALFGGAARSLAEAGLVTRARTRTNGELLSELSSAHPPLAGALAPLSGAFERAWYGHADPGEAGFAEARGHYAAVESAAAVASSDRARGGDAA